MGPAGQLLAVCVGQPREVTWRGRVVRTAIWKSPTAGRRAVGRLNVVGDAQADLAGHGGEHRAVFVYQRDSYVHWERELGRLLPEEGTFGENFTVDGLSDSEVCIGDRLAIGTAVFEVTQPRVTCFKVGLRLGEPRMPALLTGHGRPGFYLRVLQEGQVGAGDSIRLVHRDPRGLSVRRVSALLYTADRDEASLRAALGIPALPEGWRWSFRALLAAGDRPGNPGLAAQPAARPAYAGFRDFTVTRLVRESAHVLSVYLAPGDGTAPPSWLPGQFVPVRLRDGAGLVVRSYSLSVPAGPELRLSVKRDGRGSALVHGLAVGATVEVGAPRGGVGFDPAGSGPVALISAGIGVTPLLACLRAQAAVRPERRLVWVHVARSPAEHSLAAEADAALAAMPAAVRHVRYTAAQAAGVGDADGRLPLEALSDLGIGRSFSAYVCGPDGFAAEVRQMLAGLGLPAAAVHVESFGTGTSARADPRLDSLVTGRPHPPSPPSAAGWPVTFSRAGVTAACDPERFASLLELAEACDVGVRWSCRSGVCHSCESALVDGAVEYVTEPLDEPSGDVVLLCSARPTSPVTLDL
ncbi:MOSC domain-containing protein [Geodermatophilus sp. SYSU D01062]